MPSLSVLVILEGIFTQATYGPMVQGLLAGHGGPALVYYLDVSLPETLRRHATKPIAGHVDGPTVASWYEPHDLLGAPGEVVLGEELSEDAMVERLLADLAAL
ncbi:hypothetical protein GCM10009592_04150 [Brachybacterium rhamnosum]|uniref:Uncharacterized protein n=1 Tax=Brachybacterium rhamnosum TaxID=173361 RepID=A0ABW4PUF8_9MICO